MTTFGGEELLDATKKGGGNEKKIILSSILMLVFAVCVKTVPVYAFDVPIYEETFEGLSNWSADNGLWEIGASSKRKD